MPRKKSEQRAAPRHPAVVLRLAPNKFAVAVWRGDENGEPVYEIAYEDIRDVTVAATLARAVEADTRIISNVGAPMIITEAVES